MASSSSVALLCSVSVGVSAGCVAVSAEGRHPTIDSTTRLELANTEVVVVRYDDRNAGMIEALRHRGVLFVSWNGGDIRLLPGCSPASVPKYEVLPTSPVRRYFEEIQVGQSYGLAIGLPNSLPNNNATVAVHHGVRNHRVLDVVQSRLWLAQTTALANVAVDALRGCEDASHVVAAIVDGAYSEYEADEAESGVGAEASVLAIGGQRYVLGRTTAASGRPDECERSNGATGCGGAVRAYLQPLPSFNPRLAGFGAGLRWSECAGINVPVVGLEQELACRQWSKELQDAPKSHQYLVRAFQDLIRQAAARQVVRLRATDEKRLEALVSSGRTSTPTKSLLQRELRAAYAPWLSFTERQYDTKIKDVTISDLVTVKDYRSCVESGGCHFGVSKARELQIGDVCWNVDASGTGWLRDIPSWEPMRCLTKKEAEEFCAFRDARLPTNGEVVALGMLLFALSDGNLSDQGLSWKAIRESNSVDAVEKLMKSAKHSMRVQGDSAIILRPESSSWSKMALAYSDGAMVSGLEAEAIGLIQTFGMWPIWTATRNADGLGVASTGPQFWAVSWGFGANAGINYAEYAVELDARGELGLRCVANNH